MLASSPLPSVRPQPYWLSRKSHENPILVVEDKVRPFDLQALENIRGCIMETREAGRRGLEEETGWDLSRALADSSFLESGNYRSLGCAGVLGCGGGPQGLRQRSRSNWHV